MCLPCKARTIGLVFLGKMRLPLLLEGGDGVKLKEVLHC